MSENDEYNQETTTELRSLLYLLRELQNVYTNVIPLVPYRHQQFNEIKSRAISLTQESQVLTRAEDISFVPKSQLLQFNIRVLKNHITMTLENIKSIAINH